MLLNLRLSQVNSYANSMMNSMFYGLVRACLVKLSFLAIYVLSLGGKKKWGGFSHCFSQPVISNDEQVCTRVQSVSAETITR